MDELMLEMNRVLPAPAQVVFAAIADPAELIDWFGPEGFTIPTADFEPRVGARYRIEMQPPEGEAFFLIGAFREVDAPSRLVYSFAWEDPDPDDVENVVTLSLVDRRESTELTFTQGPFKTEDRRALHRDGWTDSFDKLERLISAR
jgi:uncharacterized protein YndB with AHSA1/START domain